MWSASGGGLSRRRTARARAVGANEVFDGTEATKSNGSDDSLWSASGGGLLERRKAMERAVGANEVFATIEAIDEGASC